MCPLEDVLIVSVQEPKIDQFIIRGTNAINKLELEND